LSSPRYRILVCRGPECGDKRGSAALHAELVRLLRMRGLTDRVDLEWQSCFGRCQSGPNMLVRVIRPEDRGVFQFAVLLPSASGDAVLYTSVSMAELQRIIDDHIVGGRPVRALLARRPRGGVES
jgi:(2Fe-2S) ferredoxin